MLRNPIVYLTAVAALTLIAGSPATAAVGHNVFYLSVAPRQCLIGSNASGNAGGKIVEVVPCSDPAHTLEVYAVGHSAGGVTAPRRRSRPFSQRCGASACRPSSG